MDEKQILEEIVGDHRVSQTQSGLYSVKERHGLFQDYKLPNSALAALLFVFTLASSSITIASGDQQKEKPKGPPTVVELQQIYTEVPDTLRTEANVLNLHGPGIDFKGGVGVIDNQQTDTRTDYASGVIKVPSLNDLLFLFNFNNISLDSRSYREWELRAKTNLGRVFVEGGYVDKDGTNKDSEFFSVGSKFDLSKLLGKGYFVLARGGFISSDTPSSDIGAIFGDEKGSLGFNLNGQQLRASAGYKVPNGLGFDVLYIDNKDGPTIYMVNATLDATGGFTGNPGRESRILGPTSTSFANPISDLANFNRLAYLPEIGGKASCRVRGVEKPNGDSELKGDLILFPTQWFQHGHPYLDALFFGPAYDRNGINGKADHRIGYEIGLKELDLVKGLKLHVNYRHTGSDNLVGMVTFSF